MKYILLMLMLSGCSGVSIVVDGLDLPENARVDIEVEVDADLEEVWGIKKGSISSL